MSGTKIAIKVLSQSDLSFFKAHQQRSNQKAIQLDGEVFVECFYPGLRGSLEQRVLLLTLMGPGGRAPPLLTRVALRCRGSEDWLIKGELVRDPEEEPGRYGGLMEGDFAIMAFEGHARPESVMLVLVSATEDSVLHATLAERLELTGKHGMRKVSQAVIAQLRADTLDAYPNGEHPLEPLICPDTVEDALFGTGAPAPTDARRFGQQASFSPEALRRQLLAAEQIGQQGEELFGAWLTSTGHEEGDFTWISETHTRSAYDLEVHRARWLDGTPKVFVDVKTTRGPFEREIHMSIAELRFAAETEGYRIARLYKLDGETPKLRMLTGVQAVAARILGRLESLPEGVTVDSLQIDPRLFEVELRTRLS